jgi:hypothetical protein
MTGDEEDDEDAMVSRWLPDAFRQLEDLSPLGSSQACFPAQETTA